MRCYICNRETDNFSRGPDGKFVSICSSCKSIIRDNTRKNYEDIDKQDFIDSKLCAMSSMDFLRFVERKSKCHSKKSLKSLQKNTI